MLHTVTCVHVTYNLIPAELIKNGGPLSLQVVHHLCLKIWDTCCWPTDFKKQEFVMLYNAKDSRECGNYRTIALISHCSKILLHIILMRLKRKVEAELAEEQAGFRQKQINRRHALCSPGSSGKGHRRQTGGICCFY